MTTLGAAGNLNLNDLNRLVGQEEGMLGPLNAIGNDGAQTLLQFDDTQNPPTTNTVIVTGGTGPAGKTKICQGKIFVSGSLVSGTAYR